jgi:carbonic anhydrase
MDKVNISKSTPLFKYEEVLANDESSGNTQNLFIKLVDNSLKISAKSFGKVVTLDGSIFQAQDIIFRTPSEHKINGKQYDMEMQIIHYGQTKGDIGKQVILSFVFEGKPGSYNKFIDSIDFFDLPSPIKKERLITNNLYIPKILYPEESTDFPVMKPFSFYFYEGSLTQPPCTERTIIYVASKPIPLSTSALQLFREASRIPDLMDSEGNALINTVGNANNRNIQPLNGRKVFYYNAGRDGIDEILEKQNLAVNVNSHYEKVERKTTQYMYVNSEEPTGLPGAFVVTEAEAKGLKK